MASGEEESVKEYDFSSSDGDAAVKCVLKMVSKAESIDGMEDRRDSACATVDFLISFCTLVGDTEQEQGIVID